MFAPPPPLPSLPSPSILSGILVGILPYDACAGAAPEAVEVVAGAACGIERILKAPDSTSSTEGREDVSSAAEEEEEEEEGKEVF
jgi:hypothetical protein